MTGVYDRTLLTFKGLRELYFKGRAFHLLLDEEVRETGLSQTLGTPAGLKVEGPCGKDLGAAANITT